jgi:membrane protein implicated in regulation of membrane protease activity
LGIVKQSVRTGAGKEPEREGGQETTVTVLAIFLLIIGALLVMIGALLIFIGTFLIAIGVALTLMGAALIAVGTSLLIRRLLGRDRTRSHSW